MGFPRFSDATFHDQELVPYSGVGVRIFLSARHRRMLGGSNPKAGRAIEGLAALKKFLEHQIRIAEPG